MNAKVFITYAHKDGPATNRFRQYIDDPLPPWAVDVREEATTPTPRTDAYTEECRAAIDALEERFGIELVSIEHHEIALRELAAAQERAQAAEARAEAAEKDAVAHERERCARVCDSVNNYDNPMTANDCAAAIRKGEA